MKIPEYSKYRNTVRNTGIHKKIWFTGDPFPLRNGGALAGGWQRGFKYYWGPIGKII